MEPLMFATAPRTGLFCLLLAISAPRPCGAAVTLEATKLRSGQYERIEFLISYDQKAKNPFDMDEIAVAVRLRSPSSNQFTIPAFYCQNFQRRRVFQNGKKLDWVYPIGEPLWKARVALTEVGRYEVCAEVNQKGVLARSANTVLCECTPSKGKGFLQVSRRDVRFLEFTGGQPFFALGQNLAFIGSSQYVSLSKADEIFSKLSANGANYLRIWTGCDDWALGIEARKSAWGRSWDWKPPFATLPGAVGDSPRKYVRLSGPRGKTLTISPSHPLAIRPATKYHLSGRIMSEGEALLAIEVNRPANDRRFSSKRKDGWADFQVDFTAGGDQYWLAPIVLNLDREGTVWLDALSLREAAGGPELLWEADPNRPVLGVYNTVDSFLLDELVEAAERNGIYLQLCLFTRDLYMKSLHDERSAEYQRAVQQAKKFLRYAVARWGYSTQVAAWEYFNEIDPGLPTARFYTELGEYLETIDAYHHLRTTSTWSPSPKDWRHGKLDLAQMHHYLRPTLGNQGRDEVAAIVDTGRTLARESLRGPRILGEFGLADDGWGLSPYMKQDRDLLHFHNALWASAMSGAYGTAMFWWWEQLDQHGAYRHYKPLAGFLADVPFTTAGFQELLAKTSDAKLRVVGLMGKDRAIFWLFNPQAAWWNRLQEKIVAFEIGDATVEITGLQPRRYTVQWWDTEAGKPAHQQTVDHLGAAMRIVAPRFTRDIACKIQPAP
jgi:hypothetical protein